MKVNLFIKRQDLLGEGMLVMPDRGLIAWVDILEKKLMLADLRGNNLRTYQQKSEISAVLPSVDGELILVLRNSIESFNPTTRVSRIIWSAENLEPKTNRFNDASIDPQGNLWVGSMDFDAKVPSGVLYRLGLDGSVKIIDRGYRCLNGPAFSPDGRTVYVGDTMNRQILAYDCDEAGRVDNRRVLIEFGSFDGLPDGMTVDLDGNLWVCQITAGRISCYQLDQGKGGKAVKIQSVALPVPMVTSCCFGGSNLSTLFVTTARILLDDCDLTAFDDSGSLFVISTESRGIPPNHFNSF